MSATFDVKCRLKGKGPGVGNTTMAEKEREEGRKGEAKRGSERKERPGH